VPLMPRREHEEAAGGDGGRGEPELEANWRSAGRDERITALFEEHYERLCRLAALLLGDPGGAEEVVQEAFLKTFAGWRRIRNPERAQFYLRAGVVNLCRSRMRRRVTEDRGNRVTWHSDESRLVGTGDDDARHATEALVVLDAVRALPQRQREAVVLRYYLDCSEAQMASLLGCSPGTVKSQLSKARAVLAERLGEGSGSSSHGRGSAPDLGTTATEGEVGA
jgi:RNA polymerase sigma-70 factor (sigma-E family)